MSAISNERDERVRRRHAISTASQDISTHKLKQVALWSELHTWQDEVRDSIAPTYWLTRSQMESFTLSDPIGAPLLWAANNSSNTHDKLTRALVELERQQCGWSEAKYCQKLALQLHLARNEVVVIRWGQVALLLLAKAEDEPNQTL